MRNIGDIEIIDRLETWQITIHYKKVDGTWTNYSNDLKKSLMKTPLELLRYAMCQILDKKDEWGLYMGRFIYV